ncbi:ATP-dependent helicase [Blattabacterium cuenoti]|uniref:ATP-dependent helicase n=1 Tax=Blattabacterium cuenoti TaxID=1653831 RepID=UPI00163CF319|nr:UvrD-helicase domain-containing protein [Blattabacterium cuenoti]
MNKNINNIQQKIIETINGPIIVIAGAGSGKTRVITYRIAHMIKNIKIHPKNILALTFTNKAAKEMQKRISLMIPKKDLQKITIGTFHAIFSSILRKEAYRLGFTSEYTIYDRQDSENVIKKILKDINIETKLNVKDIRNRISEYKNNLFLPSKKNEFFSKIYQLYNQRCFHSNSLDFDDILLYTNQLFSYFPNVLKKYQNQFQYILVDEYQDTNLSQNFIIKNLSYPSNNLFVVGDDAQSIYSFRGANISNILNFHNEYPHAKIFRLEQNYRSTNVIVQASNAIISFNTNQIIKNIWTRNEKGEKINIYGAISDIEEAKYIASSIVSLKKEKRMNYKDFAILYRVNSQSKLIEYALKERNIPYKIYGNISFENRKETRDLLSYFRIVINPNDEEALYRILKNQIGYKKTLNTLFSFFQQKKTENKNIYNIIKHIDIYHEFKKIKQNTRNKLKKIFLNVEKIHKEVNNKDAYQIAKNIIDFFCNENQFYNKKVIDFQYLIENINYYVNNQNKMIPKGDPSLSGFLQHFYLKEYNDQNNLINNSKHENNEVSLMTIHLSKGLEFSIVFISGLEENLFPSKSNLNDPSKIEEERRLFYVALTRAQKIARLTYAKNRFIWGKKRKTKPSRFINEINKKFLKTKNIPSFKTKSLKYYKYHTYEKNNINFEKGNQVFHESFGLGIILDIQKNQQIVTVYFKKFGKKKILLNLNKLKIYT